MGLHISEEYYVYLEKKYKNLIHNICNNISGDNAVYSSKEDNTQELLIKCIEATYAFSKKVDNPNINEFIRTKLFDQYLKTCLWNLKNNVGNNIVRKGELYNAIHIDSLKEGEGYTDVPDTCGYYDFDASIKELFDTPSPKVKQVLTLILSDPGLLKGTGSLNISKLSRRMNIPWKESKKIVTKIELLLTGDSYEI